MTGLLGTVDNRIETLEGSGWVSVCVCVIEL